MLEGLIAMILVGKKVLLQEKDEFVIKENYAVVTLSLIHI